MSTSLPSSQVKPIHVEPTQHHLRTNSMEGDSDDTGSHRSWSPVIKSRRRFSSSETKYLESEFDKHNNPSSKSVSEIAKTIGTTPRIITTWFQNHRAKEKKRMHKDPRSKKDVKKQNQRRVGSMNADFKNTSSVPLIPFTISSESTECYECNPAFGGSDSIVMPFEWDYSLHPPVPYSTWSQSSVSSQPALYHYMITPDLLSQCCVDGWYTGKPCTFHYF